MTAATADPRARELIDKIFTRGKVPNVRTVARVVTQAIFMLHDRIADLEAAQSKTLADAYRGAWLPGEYVRGQLVQHGGNVWLSVEDTSAKPGESSAWRLLVRGAR